MKKLSKIVMSFLILIALCFTFTAEAASLGAGEVYANKSAKVVEGGSGRDVDITIGLGGESFSHTISQKREVVLVLDNSGSMNEPVSSTDSTTKLEALKTATNSLLDTLLPDGVSNDTRVGIVYYSTSATSVALTNDKAALKRTVNAMVANGGTNVQYGLKLGNSLFDDKNASQSLILLSDGEPTFYTTDDGKVVGTGRDDSQACEKEFILCFEAGVKPSEAALTEAKNIKATIYSIGFGVDSNAESFLKKVSGDSRYHSANSLDSLKQAFADIVQNIDLIATNVLITDDVPNTFDIDEAYFISNFGEKVEIDDNTVKYGNVTVKTNGDGSKTVTRYVGDLKANTNNDFTFRVKAKEDYYGNMFTNGEAKVTGVAVDDNPFYIESKSIEIELEKPSVVIPAVTRDDSYSVKQGETIRGNVRDNDYKSVRKDNDAKVVDEVVVVTNVSKGSLVLDKDGKFTYIAPKDYSGDVEFTYYIKTVVEVNGNRYEVNSNTSTVTITINKIPTKYVVHYYIEGTTKKLADDYNGDGFVYDLVSADAINIDNYELISDSTQTITLGEDGNTIIFYYRLKQGGKVTVHYYIDGTTQELAKDIILSGKLTEKYNTEALNIDNWILVGVVGNTSGEFTEEEQEVIYYYEKQMGKVTVRYVDQDGNDLADNEVLTGQTSTGYQTEEKEIPNWIFVRVVGNTSGEFGKEEQEVIYYYEKQMGKVTVRYVDQDGNDLADNEVLTGQTSTGYQTEEKEIPNWIFVRVVGNTSGEFGKEEQEVIYYYEKQMGKVTVRYVDKDGNDLLESEVLTGQTSTEYNTEVKEIKGYKLVSIEGNETGEFTLEENIVVYVYELEEVKENPIINTGVTSSNEALIMLILSSLFTTGLVVFGKKINL